MFSKNFESFSKSKYRIERKQKKTLINKTLIKKIQ